MSLDFTDLSGWTPVVPWHRSGESRTLVAWAIAWQDAAQPVPNGQERCFLGPEGVGSLHEACAFPTRALAEAAMIARWPKDPQVHLAVVAIARQGPHSRRLRPARSYLVPTPVGTARPPRTPSDAGRI